MTVKLLAVGRAPQLELRALTNILRAGWYPRVLQWLGLIVFALILFFAFTGNPHGENNFATVLTWRLWWALLPLSLFLVGKVWCAVCPLATLSDGAQKLAPRPRRAPRFLRERGAWVMLALFVLLSWAHAVYDIHGTPWLTGAIFLALAFAAMVLAWRYERRAFCRYVCPVGLMSGIYAMTSPLALRARASSCRARCAKQVCAAAAPCKLFEYPRTLDSNRYCVLCGDCLHACPHDSPQMIWRAPASELAEIRKPVFAEAVFVILLLGLVIAEIVRMTPLYPALMERALLLTKVDNYALVYTLLFAALLSGLIGLAMLAARAAARDWRAAFARFAYAFVPLGLGAHVGVNFFELAAEGTRSIQTVLDNLRAPLQLFDLPPRVRGSIYASDPVLMLWQFAALALGLIATLWLIRRIARQTQARALPVAAFAVSVATAFFALYALPMKPSC